MDTFKFFREATLKICGSLEIEKALQATLLYLQKYLPVDRMTLQRFDQDFGTMHTIATATAKECQLINVLIPVSKEAQITPRLKVSQEQSEVRIFNQPQENALCREMMKFLHLSCQALMVMRLRLKEEVLGSLVVMTESDQKYTDEHGRLLSILREPFVIALANTLAHQDVIKLKNLLSDDNRFLQSELRRLSGENIIGANFGLRSVMQQVRQVAGLDSPVLLFGETGAGKDVIANALHSLSPRKDKPFIAVNCGAIPENLIDSELFGHEKGAFTGALSQKRGRFERANRGTIFLDEIGELPLPAQVRLLRVLQNKEIERVGGQEPITLDIRVIAATNRNLEAMVENKSFREDLWFRLNVFPIRIPPLRERKSDIPALVQYFIQLKAKELKLPAIPKLSDGAINDLIAYHWPGNVRELQNIVERALILNPTGPLHFEHLKHSIHSKPRAVIQEPQTEPIEKLDDVIVRHIQLVLEQTEGKIHGPAGAAELLGVNASTLRNRMKKLGIIKKSL